MSRPGALSIVLRVLVVAGLLARPSFAALECRNWEVVAPLPTGDPLHDVAAIGNRFVAVGGAGFVLVSDGGDSWDRIPMDQSWELFGIASNGQVFVAVGDRGQILVSSDGSAWESRAGPTAERLLAVEWIRGRFWAIGSERTVISSADGTNWQRSVLPEYTFPSGIAGNDERLVVATDHGDVYTSEDGLVWTLRTTGSNHPMSALIWASNRFLAVAWDGGPWTPGIDVLVSADGLKWERLPSDTAGYLISLAADGNRLIGIDAYGRVEITTNGSSWKTYRPPHSLLTKLRRIGSLFYAVGDSGDLRVTEDGRKWHRRRSELADFGVLLADEGRFLAAAGPGERYGLRTAYLAECRDGVLWTPHAPLPEPPARLLRVGDRILTFSSLGGYRATIGVTRDLDSIEVHIWQTTDWWNDLASNGALQVLAGYRNGGRPAVAISSDLENWQVIDLSSEVEPLYAIAWNGSRFLAAGQESVFTSPDGETWTRQAGIAGTTIRRLGANAGRFVGIGFASNTSSSFAASTVDGTSWSRRTFPSDEWMNDVVADESGFVAVGSRFEFDGQGLPLYFPVLWKSANGSSWTEVEVPGDGAGGWYARLGTTELLAAGPLSRKACSDLNQVDAGFDLSPVESAAGQLVTFSAAAVAPSFELEWDFGDGGRAVGPIASHVFATPGRYEVHLTLKGAFGETQTRQTIDVRCADIPTCQGQAPNLD